MFYPGASFHLAVLFTTNQKRMHKAGETFNFELIFMAAMSRNTRYWLSQLCGWGLFALINIFFAYSYDKLIFKSFLQQVKPENNIPHHVSKQEPNGNKNEQPEIKFLLLFC